MQRQSLLRARLEAPAAAHAFNGAYLRLFLHHSRNRDSHIADLLTLPAAGALFFLCDNLVETGNTQCSPQGCKGAKDSAKITVAGQGDEQKACVYG